MAEEPKRTYVSPLRADAAAATRRRILSAAKREFVERGWPGTTLGAVANVAEVSSKTIQAQFGTKAKLLADTVDFAIRGEAREEAAGRRATAQAIRAAENAREALVLHAAMSTQINQRAASLAAVVEAAAASDAAVALLWQRMRDNMQLGVRWAAETILGKPGLRSGLTVDQAETVFQVAMAWSTYRTLTLVRGMSPEEIEAWISHMYERMLLL